MSAEHEHEHDDLLARAKERAEASPLPEGWGYRIQLAEDEDFDGRWRGETVDEENTDDEGHPRRIFLVWDAEGERCFSRYYTALAREIDRVKPQRGDRIVIYRGRDYSGPKGTGFAYGVETEPNDAPLPDDDGFPF